MCFLCLKENILPLPNFHSARIKSPKKYKRFAYKKNEFGSGVDVVYGIKADGKSEVQAIRFARSKFTADQAKSWIKKHKYSGSFEPAKAVKSDFIYIPPDSVISEYLGNIELEDWVNSTNNIVSLCERGVIEIGADFDTFAVEMVNSRYRDDEAEGDVWLYETFDFDLSEAKFDDKTKALSLRIIQGENSTYNGISKNGNFYSSSVIEALVPHLEQRSKMFINHQSRESAKRGEPRDLKDWAATIKEVWVNDGGAYVKADMCDNQNNWLFTEAKKHPEQIGVSIDAYVVAKKGKKHGIECNIIEKWHFLNSADFVGDPSAGGITIGISEEEKKYATAFCNIAEQLGGVNLEISEKIKKLFEAAYKDIFDKNIERSKFNQIWYTAEDLIRYNIINDKDMSEDEKRNGIVEVLELLKSYILDLNFEDIKYGFESIINNRININTLGGESSVKTEEILEILKTASFDSLKQAGNVVVLEEAVKEATETVEGTISSTKEEHKKVVSTKDTKITDLEEDVKNKEKEIAKLKEDNRVRDNTVKIDKFLSDKDNKINKALIIPTHLETIKHMKDDELDKALEELKVFSTSIKKVAVDKFTTLSKLEEEANGDNGKATEEFSRKSLVKILKK